MSPRRNRPITALQAGAGLLAIVVGVIAVVALSYALLIPAEVEPDLPAAVTADEPPNVGPRRCALDGRIAEEGQPVAVTSDELIECAEFFDGMLVRFEGEAVGAVMRRGERAWVHVNDDVYGVTLGPLPTHRLAAGGNTGMAVNIPAAAADGVVTGSFNRHGTGLAVTGVYLLNHPEDRGAPAIHADRVAVVRDVTPIGHPVAKNRWAVAAVLTLIVAFLAAVKRRQT